MIDRRYLEFYVLESKLTEFHGENKPGVLEGPQDVFCLNGLLSLFKTGTFEDAQLPSKRIIGPKNSEFLESKREEFQEYLQVFTPDVDPQLQKSDLFSKQPNLRRSSAALVNKQLNMLD